MTKDITTKILTVGGDAKFIGLLNKITDGGVASFTKIDDALAHPAKETAEVLFVLPRYDEGEDSIPELDDATLEKLAALIGEGKTKLYIENYPSYDYRDCFIFGAQARGPITSVNKNSLCLSGAYKDALGFEILQKRGGRCFPSATHTHERFEVLLEVKNCLGTHKVLKDDGAVFGVALMRSATGVYCAMADLTRLVDNEIFPYTNWRRFYAHLLCELTGAEPERIEAAFSEVYARPALAKCTRPMERKEALINSINETLLWHRHSGIMSEGGRKGVWEMIRSFDLMPAKNVRGDSSLFTAALFMAAGKYFSSDDDIKTAEAIIKNVLDERELQITEGENRGLFKWFATNSGLGPRSVYVSDTSRSGNLLIALYRLTGAKEYLERAVMVGEALLEWFGGDALFPLCAINYEKDTLRSIQGNRRRLSGEFYDAPIILLGNLYDITGDERYLKQVIMTAERLALAFPNYDAETSHSDNFTYSRLLGALAVAQRFSDGVWTPIINELLAYFKRLQHSSGGFFDDRVYVDGGNLNADVEFAVGVDREKTYIADLVYCQNTLLYSLNILLSASGEFNRDMASKMLDGLVEFLLDTQMVSEDARFRGAWMRAFDMENMEYYGCDKDFAWGPYCILTGWVTGAIPLVFFDMLGLKTMY